METILALICERTSGQVSNRVIVAGHSLMTVEERCGKVEVLRVGTALKAGAVSVCPTMPSLLAREKADLIVIHEPNPMGLLAYYLVRPETALIVWFHSEVVRPGWQYRLFYRPLLHFALRRAAKIVVASPTLASSAPQLHEWQSKCVVIPYGIDVGSSSPGIVRRAQQIRNASKRPIVLFVGRLVAYKGAGVLLEAMRDLDAETLLVGEGPLRATLEHQATELGIADRVKFLGEVTGDELSAIYRACDIFVLPSLTRQEAFGVVQIEAMAHGKPVISTDLGTGVAWVNQNGETGLVVQPGDAASLRGAIEALIADEPRRVALGEAAARRARSQFNVDRMIDSTLHLYGDVLGRYVSGVA